MADHPLLETEPDQTGKYGCYHPDCEERFDEVIDYYDHAVVEHDVADYLKRSPNTL